MSLLDLCEGVRIVIFVTNQWRLILLKRPVNINQMFMALKTPKTYRGISTTSKISDLLLYSQGGFPKSNPNYRLSFNQNTLIISDVKIDSNRWTDRTSWQYWVAWPVTSIIKTPGLYISKWNKSTCLGVQSKYVQFGL